MIIGILGTGVVGRTLGTRLAKLGHEVRMGSRAASGEKAEAWVKEAGARASEGTFAAAADHSPPRALPNRGLQPPDPDIPVSHWIPVVL
ncbi:MAG: hypothetical protein PVSMB1_03360 [Gemmatimonadaceae bacterium]